MTLHFSVAVFFAIPLASTGAVIAFIVLTYTTLLLGHSVGMHRRLIHRSYDCVTWLDGTLVYLGVLVGMTGPLSIIRVHDIRDWAQRESDCHDFFSHRRSLFVDALWQLNCYFSFDHPPSFNLEDQTSRNLWFRFLQRTWMLQQVPLALVLYACGGWGWVVWGVSVRIVVSVTGHWVITYLTHNPGPGSWYVPDAGVQASDRPGLGLITMGECWHNNHHAFPESARIGLDGQFDPGWWVIQQFERAGWVSRVGLPRDESQREDLIRVAPVDVPNPGR